MSCHQIGLRSLRTPRSNCECSVLWSKPSRRSLLATTFLIAPSCSGCDAGHAVRRKHVVRWAPQATTDLELAHEYLHARHPDAAQRLARGILQAVERLRAHPEIGPVAPDLLPKGRYRHWICGNHCIIYRVEGRMVWILRVWDTRQSPQRLRVGG